MDLKSDKRHRAAGQGLEVGLGREVVGRLVTLARTASVSVLPVPVASSVVGRRCRCSWSRRAGSVSHPR